MSVSSITSCLKNIFSNQSQSNCKEELNCRVLGALSMIDRNDSSWLSAFAENNKQGEMNNHSEREGGGGGLRNAEEGGDSDTEEDTEEIIPPRVHDHAAQRLLCADAGFSSILVRWGPNQSTAPHVHAKPESHFKAWMVVVKGRVEQVKREADSKNNIIHTESIFVSAEDGPMVDYGFMDGGEHQVRNASSRDVAIVLHVFTPLYCESCFTRDSALRMPLISNLSELATILDRGIAEMPKEGFHSADNINIIKCVLEATHLPEETWSTFKNFSEDRYTRTLIGKNDKFTMLVLCWNKSQASPVHDHSGSSCWVKCLEGQLKETRYHFPTSEDHPLEEKGVVVLKDGGVAYINDSQGLHKMGNPSDKEGCVTLHIYSPPFSQSKIFNLETSQSTTVNIIANASKALF